MKVWVGGDSAGLVFVQDRNSSAGMTSLVEGGGSIDIVGGFYLPSQTLDIGGNAELSVGIDQAIVGIPDFLPSVWSGGAAADQLIRACLPHWRLRRRQRRLGVSRIRRKVVYNVGSSAFPLARRQARHEYPCDRPLDAVERLEPVSFIYNNHSDGRTPLRLHRPRQRSRADC
jgi:hypothetical protein